LYWRGYRGKKLQRWQKVEQKGLFSKLEIERINRLYETVILQVKNKERRKNSSQFLCPFNYIVKLCAKYIFAF